MHWDERDYLIGGLARLMHAKYGGGTAPRPADSSASSTVDDEPQGLDLFQALGGQVRTEEVSAE